MSGAPKKAIPRPALPEDFEELTRTLFAEIWEVPLAALHGGRGQRQYGVDVLADSPKGRFGIQCKLHDAEIQLSAKQLASELEGEIEKAKGFKPPLDGFVFATTARRRGEVQRLAAEINERHREADLFEATAFFWEDFEEHLRLYPDVLQPYMGRHYPDLYPPEPAAPLSVPRRRQPTATKRPYAAFVSYAHRYKPWVRILHRNLERCLAADGETRKIFLDQTDLASGRSWVGQLQAGLAKADALILVATPEALASPRVSDEWQSFMATRRDWAQGHLHVVELVDAPLPPFLEQIHRLDFRRHGADRYRDSLLQLASGLLGRVPRELPKLPEDVEVPAPPRSSLAPERRAELVVWLTPTLQSKVFRRAVTSVLGLDLNALEDHPSFESAASAALVYATGDDDPLKAARRTVDILIEELNEDLPREVEQLRGLRKKLIEPPKVKPETEHAGLIEAFLTKVVKDHEKLVPYFQQRAELDLLDRVYVPLELRPEHRETLELDDEKLRPGRSLSIRELLALDPEKQEWVTHRWVILGDPGAGKTTLLRHLAATEARKRPPERVPIFESLPRLMREREWLFDRLARQMTQAGYPAQGLPAVLERAGQEGRLLLLLDGLDEVPRESRDEAECRSPRYSGRRFARFFAGTHIENPR